MFEAKLFQVLYLDVSVHITLKIFQRFSVGTQVPSPLSRGSEKGECGMGRPEVIISKSKEEVFEVDDRGVNEID